MQRLFSTFANGWPGGGLLLQRLLAGGALIYCGVASMTAAHQVELEAPRILGAVLGILLLAGLWTPLAGAVTAVVEAWIAFSNPGKLWMPLAMAVLGASLAMIGPGAWSLDARLFGRKRIEPHL